MSIGKLLGAGLMCVGVVLGGAHAWAAPAPEPEKKNDQKKDDDKGSGAKKAEDPLGPAFEELLKRFGDQGNMTPEQIDQLRKQFQKAFEQLNKQMPGGALPGGALPGGLPGGFPILPGIGGIGGIGGLGGPGAERVAVRENLRLGAKLEKPTETLVEQLDLPRGQGQVVTQLNDESPAAKAGLKAHDILLELDGKPVSSDAKEFAKQLGDIKADTAVEAIVLRKGKKETIKGLSLPEDTKPTTPKRPRLGGLRGLPGGVLPVVP